MLLYKLAFPDLIFGRALNHLHTTEKVISLTFDDGPNPDATPLILDTLAKENVKATFFFLGSHVDMWPEIVKRAAQDGHQIANHGYFHRKLHFKSPRYTSRDVRLGAQAIKKACGVSPKWFRAPHGFRNLWLDRITAEQGQSVAGWTLGVWDTDMPGIGEIADRVLTGVRPGSIVLLHDGDGYNPKGNRLQTAAALKLIIQGLRKRGYSFATL